MKYHPALDGLRAFAVSAVIAFHVIPWRIPGGWVGVDVFFVLSGFLITNILRSEMNRSGKLRIARFYVRRALRLLPAFVVVLIFVVVTEAIRDADFNSVLKTVLISATYMMNWSMAFGWKPNLVLQHTWSLSIEEQFYLIWPLAMILLNRTKMVYWVVAAIIIEIGWRCFLVFSGIKPERVYFGFDTHSDALLIGCVIALSGLQPKLGKQLNNFGFLPICGLSIMVFGLDITTSHPVGLTVVALLSGWIIVLALQEGYVRRFLSMRYFVFTGRISYGLYLWHWPLILIFMPYLSKYTASGPVILGVIFIITYVMATASYFLVEKPFLRIKSRFAVQEHATPPTNVQDSKNLLSV